MNEMKIVMFLSCALFTLTAACTEPAPIEPLGLWDDTYTWSAGTCQLTGTAKFPFTVVDAGSGSYVLVNNDPVVTSVTGTVRCTQDRCDLTLHETFTVVDSGTTTTGTHDASLVLDEANVIRGSGTIAFRFQNGATCSQTFSSTGLLR